jgi:hypothetical protein
MNDLAGAIIGILLLGQSAYANLPVPVTVSSVQYSLSDRYGNSFVNDVFADNILLSLAYLRGIADSHEKISWEAVRKPFIYHFSLKPGETFAFHDDVLPQFRDQVTLTTNAHFTAQEGFKSDGYLIGDGVCHLASFLRVAALRAGLLVLSPTRHDFAAIADVAPVDAVTIYYDPKNPAQSANKNLYITNNKIHDITFLFDYRDRVLSIKVAETI